MAWRSVIIRQGLHYTIGSSMLPMTAGSSSILRPIEWLKLMWLLIAGSDKSLLEGSYILRFSVRRLIMMVVSLQEGKHGITGSYRWRNLRWRRSVAHISSLTGTLLYSIYTEKWTYIANSPDCKVVWTSNINYGGAAKVLRLTSITMLATSHAAFVANMTAKYSNPSLIINWASDVVDPGSL